MAESLHHDGSEFEVQKPKLRETLATLESLGREYVEVFSVARELFPDSEYLEKLDLYVDNQSDQFGAIVTENESGQLEPHILIGNAPMQDMRKKVERAVSRLGVDAEILNRGPYAETLTRFAIFAHELGHIIQVDPAYAEQIGELTRAPLKDMKNYTDEEYEAYVTATAESNADYLAAVILSRCPDVNSFLNVQKPQESLSQYQQWVAKRPSWQTEYKQAA